MESVVECEVESNELCKSLSELKEHECINWTGVVSLIREKSKFLFYSRHVREVCNILPDLLLKHDCDDSRLVMNIMDMYRRWWLFGPELSSGIDHMEKSEIGNIMEPLLSDDYHMGYFHHSIQHEDFQLGVKKACQVMLKYGILAEPTNVHDLGRIYYNTADLIMNSFNDILDVDLVTDSYDNNFKDLHHIKYIFFNYDGWRTTENRYFLLASVIRAILKDKREGTPNKYVECFNLYLRSVPAPYPSEEEISTAMLNIFEVSFFKEQVAQEMVDDYKDCFGSETSRLLRPRRLKHLCRCAVRKALLRDGMLQPKSVRNLRIPEALKEYLFGMK